MDEVTLRQLIDGGETATVEFKSSAARPIDIAVRMCGIANNRAGGIIIFGIEDATRAIVGIRNPSLTNDVVSPQQCRRYANGISPIIRNRARCAPTDYRH